MEWIVSKTFAHCVSYVQKVTHWRRNSVKFLSLLLCSEFVCISLRTNKILRNNRKKTFSSGMSLYKNKSPNLFKNLTGCFLVPPLIHWCVSMYEIGFFSLRFMWISNEVANSNPKFPFHIFFSFPSLNLFHFLFFSFFSHISLPVAMQYFSSVLKKYSERKEKDDDDDDGKNQVKQFTRRIIMLAKIKT